MTHKSCKTSIIKNIIYGIRKAIQSPAEGPSDPDSSIHLSTMVKAIINKIKDIIFKKSLIPLNTNRTMHITWQQEFFSPKAVPFIIHIVIRIIKTMFATPGRKSKTFRKIPPDTTPNGIKTRLIIESIILSVSQAKVIKPNIFGEKFLKQQQKGIQPILI